MKGDVFSSQGLESGVKETKFVGYAKSESKSKILKIIKGAVLAKKISKDEEATIILDQSPFYPESGGQVGDAGELVKGKNVFSVLYTKKSGKIIMHTGKVKQGSFKNADLLSAQIDLERRINIARNHTATHLLQAALRKVLGAHVQQQGSLVAQDRLRFDFTHFKDIDEQVLRRIEGIVNEYVLDNQSLQKREMTLAMAKKSGALAFFGDKYEAKVRVVSIGDVSKEFCGGTHLNSTGQIGIFKIVQEGSVASGVRRIEALTGKMAYKAIEEKETVVDNIASVLGVPVEKIIPELEKRLSRFKELEKELSHKRLDTMKTSLDSFIQDAQEINGIKVITKLVENADIDLLRKTLDLIKAKENKAVIALGANIQGRALLVLGVSPDLSQQGVDAVALIRDVASVIGGNGGGRKDFAQAGGNNPAAFEAAFEKLKDLIKNLQL